MEGTSSLIELESRFFEAIKENDESTVTSLLNNRLFKKHVSDADKLTLAFVQVVLLNNVNLLKILEAHGVDIAGTDCLFEENGVMHAARYGHTEMLSYLLSAGVGVNHQSENGSTAIHVAVENSQHECLKLLVKQKGVDLNIQDVSGLSPLLWTAKLRDWKAMKVLIDAGCNIHSTDYRNRVNALHVSVDGEKAFWKGKTVTATDIVDCVDLIINAGVDIDVQDIHGNTALVYAVASDNFPAVKHLLRLNCDVEGSEKTLPNDQRSTAYHFPKISNQPHVCGYVMCLIPLYSALSKLQFRTAKMLVTAGISYHKLASEPAVISYLDRNKPMKQYFEEIIQLPRSLMQSCRIAIRRSIGQGIMWKCDKLVIPEKLRNFILLAELDSM